MDLSETSLRKYENSIHDPISKVLIPVRTSANSRIGQFALSHGLSAKAFDEVVALLNDPEIRASEVTFSSGERLFRTVAEHRERLQTKRSFSVLGFPPVVLGGVINVMYQDSGSFVTALPGNDINFQNEDGREAFCTLIHNLRNMALVHRSWVEPVHRLLHMRYCVTGKTIPKAPPHAVAVAIRELAVDYQYHEIDSSLRSLINFLGHLPNLRSLSIGKLILNICQYTQAMYALIEAIGRLSNLEVLLFPSWKPQAVDTVQIPAFLKLCKALSNLKSLSVVWLSHLQSYDDEDAKRLHREILADLQPPILKTLVINAPLHPSSLPGMFIRWINNPRGRPSLETLIVSPDRGHNADPEMILDLGDGPAFSKLKCVYTNRSVYNAILPNTQGVKVLCLSMVEDRLPNRLPPRLKRLHTQFSRGDQLADAAIVSLLHQSDTGSLETIELYEVSSREMFDWNETTRFPLLIDFCRGLVELDHCHSGHNEWTQFGVVVRSLLP